ncbi:MAG: DUF1972 domain-containing protein [Bifidobacteriaceae bacterium]|jgi:glycosyltransferase involved in cell wall biosynthesis|nr:DUF1972 domain-containing protein [Bifidobacteriaceae bacterium]
MVQARPTVRILGTHGVPAAYGGFETAAENVGLYLAEHGWRVIVYCQTEGTGAITSDVWRGLERINIPVNLPGWRGTSLFDAKCVAHASRFRDVCLVFGYNTGIFNLWQRLLGTPLAINMDGIEWSRSRWGFTRQMILYINERFSALAGNALIADHPVIAKYLAGRAPKHKIVTITYGAYEVRDAPEEPVLELGLEPGKYVTVVCRAIPENSVLELVEGFSRRKREYKLVVIGEYDLRNDPYHRTVRRAASAEVVFPGAVFDQERLGAIRFHSALYAHGHTVGGTNPSLVEAMAAGNPVLAHNNAYNRWTAGPEAAYFVTADHAAIQFDRLLPDPARLIAMSEASLARYREEFTWERVARKYEALLSRLARGEVPS